MLRKYLPSIDQNVNRVGYWTTFLTGVAAVLTAVGTALYSGASWLNSFEAAAAAWVIAIAVAVFAAAVLVGLVAWAYERVLAARIRKTVLESPNPGSNPPQAINTSYEVDMEPILKALQVAVSLEDRFRETKQTVDTLAQQLRAVDTKNAAINERIENTATSFTHRLDWLSEKVSAQKTVYEMHRLKRDLDRLAILLERPLKQAKDGRDWRGWSDRFRKFRRALEQFEALAARFYPKEAPNLTFVPPHVYRLAIDDFEPDNFPNHEMAYDFKTFRSMSVTFKELGSDLIKMIEGKT